MATWSDGKPLSIDCSEGSDTCFGSLFQRLNRWGYRIDHFHCFKYVEVDEKYEGRRVAKVIGEKLCYFAEHAWHLNVGGGGSWSRPHPDLSNVAPMNVYPRLFDRIIADEAHGR